MTAVYPTQLTEKTNKSTLIEHASGLKNHPIKNASLPISHPRVFKNISMKRIAIVGSSGSGKSTLARQLGDALDLPVIHLDKHFWHPGWVGTLPQEWNEKVHQFATQESWIIDGNYRSTLDIRLQTADTVIFLDLPRWLCAWRATKRRFQYRNRQRPDIADGCQERIFDPMFPRFIKWVWNYPHRARPNILKTMRNLPADKRFVWLKTSQDVNSFAEQPQQWISQHGHTDGAYDFFVTARLDG